MGLHLVRDFLQHSKSVTDHLVPETQILLQIGVIVVQPLILQYYQLLPDPNPDEQPLLDISVLPSFPQRLRLIGKAVESYRRFEPIMGRYQDLGRRLSQLP